MVGNALKLFRNERELLTRLNHSGIARLIDAGALEGGASRLIQIIGSLWSPGNRLTNSIMVSTDAYNVVMDGPNRGVVTFTCGEKETGRDRRRGQVKMCSTSS